MLGVFRIGNTAAVLIDEGARTEIREECMMSVTEERVDMLLPNE